ncbi:MAG: pilus assembly protein [Clostridiales bacterium]|nr:pilus assembly protein [Clostridiales bacterium]
MGDERGSAAAELAFTLTVLLLLFFAMVEMAFLFHENLALAAAARTGARQAAVLGGDDEGGKVRDAIWAELAGLSLQGEGVTIAIRPRQARYGTPITVHLEKDYAFVTPLPRLMGLKPLRLQATATARSEYLVTPVP